MISVLSDETVLNETKMKSMTILRKLSNYKKNPEISQSILKDLGDLGFTDFLCDLIRTEENIEQKLEYIKGFVEYLDDSSIEIQTSFLNYLMKDQASRFLRSLQSFVSDTFQDIKMLEKGKSDSINRSQRAKLKSIINKKINSCIYVIEMLRLSCENHFADVQNFFRRGVSEPDQ
jgi:inositol 1,4,5-triphosphate receptor type 3